MKDSHLFFCERVLPAPCFYRVVRWSRCHRDVFSSLEGQQRLFLSTQSLQKVLQHCDSLTICCYCLRIEDQSVNACEQEEHDVKSNKLKVKQKEFCMS